MPTSHKSPDLTDNNLMLLIGQLMESARLASESLKSLSAEGRASAGTISVLERAVKDLESRLQQLENLVQDGSNPANLFILSREHRTALDRLRNEVSELQSRDAHAVNSAARKAGITYTIQTIGIWLGWSITTAIALYAALRGK